jgi:precorrin-3B synthase
VPLRENTARTHPDSCPGVLAVHQAADGGLARVRLPGGVLSTDQLQGLAAASVELGAGNLELTSRANLQIRALRPGAAQALSDRLYSAGLLPSMRHERVRNILASPLSGLDPHSLYDVLPTVAELDRQLCARPALAVLPGRFLFALDDGRGDLAGLGADVGVQALPGGRVALLLAGADTGVRVPREDLVPVMLAAAEAFLAERTAQGSEAWRLAELADGTARVLGRLGLEGHGGRLGPMNADTPGNKGPPIGIAGGGGTAGECAVVVGVRLGRLGVREVEGLVGATGGSGEVRVTPWRSVVLGGVAVAEVDGVVERLGAAGLLVDPESPWGGVTACAGRPGCAKALADVRGDARRVTPSLPAGSRVVHWSGCERRCGRPAGEFVDVVAVDNGYLVDGVVTSKEDAAEAIAARRMQ